VIVSFVLPRDLRAQLIAEARRAFPIECCGLVSGLINQSIAHGTALHPARNLSAACDRFEIDPARHIALSRELRGTAQSLIGCYHSHPNGSAAPSPRDCDNTGENSFLWLIAALDGDAEREVQIAAFASAGIAFLPVNITDAQLDRAAATPL